MQQQSHESPFQDISQSMMLDLYPSTPLSSNQNNSLAKILPHSTIETIEPDSTIEDSIEDPDRIQQYSWQQINHANLLYIDKQSQGKGFDNKTHGRGLKYSEYTSEKEREFFNNMLKASQDTIDINNTEKQLQELMTVTAKIIMENIKDDNHASKSQVKQIIQHIQNYYQNHMKHNQLIQQLTTPSSNNHSLKQKQRNAQPQNSSRNNHNHNLTHSQNSITRTTQTNQWLLTKLLITQFITINRSQPPNTHSSNNALSLSLIPSNQPFTPFTPQSVFEAEKLLQMLNLWNRRVTCQSQFDLEYFARACDIPRSVSRKEKRLSLFVKVYLYPKIAVRLLRPVLTIQSLQQVQFQTHIHPTILSFYLNSHQQQSIEHKIAYLTYLSKFFTQILADYSSSTNPSLASAFNCTRFLFMNFISFFTLQLFVYIENQIMNQYGQLYFVTFIFKRNNNKRWIDYKKKILQCLKITHQKIKNYTLEFSSPNKSGNSKKLKLMFENNSKIKKLYNELNQPSKPNMQQKMIELYEKKYFPDKAKQIYAQSIQIITTECCNQIIFERTIKNKPLKMKDYEALCEKYNISLNSFDEDQINKIQLNSLQDKKLFEKLLQDYAIIHLTNLKCFCLAVAFPFYSFENYHENLRRKLYLEQISKNHKPAIQLSDTFFANIDRLYIFKKARFDDQYLAQYREHVINHITPSYLKITNELMDFISKDSLVMKEKYLKQELFNMPNVLPDEKPFHNKRMAVFELNSQDDACMKTVYLTHQYIKNPSMGYEVIENEWTRRWQKQTQWMHSQSEGPVVRGQEGGRTQTLNYITYMRRFQKNMKSIQSYYNNLKEQIAIQQLQEKRQKYQFENKLFLKNRGGGNQYMSKQINERTKSRRKREEKDEKQRLRTQESNKRG